jgi:hypothetical protein
MPLSAACGTGKVYPFWDKQGDEFCFYRFRNFL